MRRLRNRHFFLTDLLFLPLAAYLSFVLRLDAFDLGRYWLPYLLFAALVVVIIPAMFRSMGLYQRYWRYASVEELALLVTSITAAVLVLGMLSLLSGWLSFASARVPRSVPIIFFLLALVATAGPRLAVRLWSIQTRRKRPKQGLSPALIIGAGEAGRVIARELQHDHQSGLEVIGFIDDDPHKHRMRIHGVAVLGNRRLIPALVQRYHIKHVIIAMPSAPGKEIRDILSICEGVGVRAKTVPQLAEIVDGRVTINQLRDVQIEDLLRRSPVRTDVAAVSELLRGKRVLITGAGGSIGSELSRQVLRCGPSELVLLGHGENSIFEIHNELCKVMDLSADGASSGCRLTPVIADIRFAERIRAVFEEHRPEVVFHAAAHKHVPMMESNVSEAVSNNILGTRNLLDAVQAVGTERFVLISSDKAVNPTSVMGVAKRVAELLVHQAARQSGKAYVAVRFGNVLGSRGSVVLTFKKQIASGGPVTITHPDMRRFFMTIPEAVQLVLQAAVLGEGGEVFVLDMGQPIKIADLARDMIELSGLEVGRDIDIVCTGLRPGEKLFEELFVMGESYKRTQHEKIFIAANASSLVPDDLDEALAELALAVSRDEPAVIRRQLEQLVPDYRLRHGHAAKLEETSASDPPRERLLQLAAGQR